jgi:hypothetical protein
MDGTYAATKLFTGLTWKQRKMLTSSRYFKSSSQAVGHPWDCSLKIYRTPYQPIEVKNKTTYTNVTTCTNVTLTASTSFPTETLNQTATTTLNSSTNFTDSNSQVHQVCSNTTLMSNTFTLPEYPAVNWELVTILADPRNITSTQMNWDGTSRSSALSLFGYDVKFSSDAKWLVVGVPGRSFSYFSSLPSQSLAWHPYHGSAIMYSRNGTTFTLNKELDIGSFSKPNRYFDRFGSKVLFSPDPTSNFLFVVSNGGWDGVSAPGKLKDDQSIPSFADSENNQWPQYPTTFTGNLGVYVFQYNLQSLQWYLLSLEFL